MKYKHHTLLPAGAFNSRGSVVNGRSMRLHGDSDDYFDWDAWNAQAAANEAAENDRLARENAERLAAEGYARQLEDYNRQKAAEAEAARQAAIAEQQRISRLEAEAAAASEARRRVLLQQAEEARQAQAAQEAEAKRISDLQAQQAAAYQAQQVAEQQRQAAAEQQRLSEQAASYKPFDLNAFGNGQGSDQEMAYYNAAKLANWHMSNGDPNGYAQQFIDQANELKAHLSDPYRIDTVSTDNGVESILVTPSGSTPVVQDDSGQYLANIIGTGDEGNRTGAAINPADIAKQEAEAKARPYGTGEGQALGYSYGIKNVEGDIYKKYDAQGNLTEFLDKDGKWQKASDVKPTGTRLNPETGKLDTIYSYGGREDIIGNSYVPGMSPYKEDQGGFLGEGGWGRIAGLVAAGLTAGLAANPAMLSGIGLGANAGKAVISGIATVAQGMSNGQSFGEALLNGVKTGVISGALSSALSSLASPETTAGGFLGSYEDMAPGLDDSFVQSVSNPDTVFDALVSQFEQAQPINAIPGSETAALTTIGATSDQISDLASQGITLPKVGDGWSKWHEFADDPANMLIPEVTDQQIPFIDLTTGQGLSYGDLIDYVSSAVDGFRAGNPSADAIQDFTSQIDSILSTSAGISSIAEAIGSGLNPTDAIINIAQPTTPALTTPTTPIQTPAEEPAADSGAIAPPIGTGLGDGLGNIGDDTTIDDLIGSGTGSGSGTGTGVGSGTGTGSGAGAGSGNGSDAGAGDGTGDGTGTGDNDFELKRRKNGEELTSLLSQMATGQVKSAIPAQIDYMYDISGDSLFATPKQESLMPSPFEDQPEAVEGAMPRYQYYDPKGGYLYAGGGMVSDEYTIDDLYRMLGSK